MLTNLGDTTTLLDPSIVDEIMAGALPIYAYGEQLYDLQVVDK